MLSLLLVMVPMMHLLSKKLMLGLQWVLLALKLPDKQPLLLLLMTISLLLSRLFFGEEIFTTQSENLFNSS